MKTVLVVEDEIPNLKALHAELTTHGYDVIDAHDGEEGLKLALEKKPDLIILDIIMPKVDGMTVLKKLRADAWGKNVPILMLSNVDSSEAVSEGMANRASRYFVKADMKLTELVSVIGSYLK